MPILRSLIVLLALASPSWADVFIAAKHRVANRPPGYCVWCCLETLGRNQGVAKLRGLADARANDPDFVEADGCGWRVVPKNYGTVSAVKSKLGSLGVKYRLTLWDYGHLSRAVNKSGAVVFLYPNPQMPEAHAVILTDLTDGGFRYIDPNTCTYWRGGRAWFDAYWAGVCITVGD